MKRSFLFLIIVLSPLFAHAQNGWTNKNIFYPKNFIENNGQNDGEELPNKQKILFTLKIDGLVYFFTKTGYTICYSEAVALTKEEEIEQEREDEKDREREEEKRRHKVIKKFHEQKWMDTDPALKIISENEVSNYYSYVDLKSQGERGTIIAKAYRKIIYKNIYPKTDIVFEIPEDSTGIKYSIHLHPGADIQKVKMSFPGESFTMNSDGDLEISSAFGIVTDHKPASYTAAEKEIIKSHFIVNGKQVGFGLENAPSNKEIIIDPWTITPPFALYNRAFDVDYDNQGNVYVYGGISWDGPFELLKFDPTGSLLWTFTPTVFTHMNAFYGDFAIDRRSNSLYLTEGFRQPIGAQIVKISPVAMVMATFPGNNNFEEMWRITFNDCTHEAVIGGGGTSNGTFQSCILDTSLLALSPVATYPALCCKDVGSIAFDNAGNCYQAFVSTIIPFYKNNNLLKLPMPALVPSSYNVNTHYHLNEGRSNQYYGYSVMGNVVPIGFNGLATSNNTVYSTDSYVLKKWNGPTGALIDSVIIHPSVTDTMTYWGGIAADDCGNLFVADTNILRQYDTLLNLVNSTTMPGAITDIVLSSNGKLYVCGLGFLSSLELPGMINCLDDTFSSTNGTCTSLGSGTMTVAGGVPPYAVTWNTTPVQTGTTVLAPPGTYIATVMDAACPSNKLTDTLVIGGDSLLLLNTTSINSCYGGTTGSVVAAASGGIASSPYQYIWTGFSSVTGNTLTGIPVGSYTVTVTNDTCSITSVQIVSSDPILTGNINAMINCGDSYTLPGGDVASGSGSFQDTVKTAGGCDSLITVLLVTDISSLDIKKLIPNAFSPNEDNLNDQLCIPENSCIKKVNIAIYDRWGEKVFESDSMNGCWDGTFRGKKLEAGVFVYYFTVEFVDGSSSKGKGNISLIQ